jgi:hypothetical protein
MFGLQVCPRFSRLQANLPEAHLILLEQHKDYQQQSGGSVSACQHNYHVDNYSFPASSSASVAQHAICSARDSPED